MNLMEQLLDTLPDTLCLHIGQDMTIRYCNPLAQRWLGKRGGDLLGRSIHDMKHPLLGLLQDPDWQQKVDRRAGGLEKKIRFALRGNLHRFDTRLKSLQDVENRPMGYLFQACDQSRAEACLLKLRLQRLQELARIGSWELNLKTLKAIWSSETRQIMGVSEDIPACPETLMRIIHPADRKRVAETMRSAAENRSFYDVEYRVKHADGQWHTLHSRADRLYDESERVFKLIGFVQDVTHLKEVEDRNRLSASVFDNSLNPILIMDTEGIIQQVNRAFSQITGYLPQEVIGRSQQVYQSEQQDEAFNAHVKQVLAAEGSWEGEIVSQRKNGETFPVWQSISAVRDAQGQQIHYVCAFSDITEQKLSADYIYQLAHYDVLTGLPNRVLFSERCKHAIERGRRNDQKTALLYLDLDRFKQINDSLGHPVGDELLEKVAERLIQQVREEDTVARLGGDEFVLVLEQINDERDAERVALKILDALRAPFHLKEHELVVSASIGISLSPADGEDVTTLIKHADLAMYRAKEKGRDNFQFFSHELSKDSLEYHLLETDLRYARERNELLLCYQPQYDLKSGRLIGAEALLRWQHQTKGLLLPNKFVPIAEESGLILNIGEWVLTTACRQAKQWLDAGLALGRISVNLSGLQIQRGNVVAMVREILGQTGLPAEFLELEILETYIMRQVEKDIGVLEELRDIGVHLAIDDFGTGQSCLGYLKRLPVERLKIDRSFVMDTPHDADSVAITRAIIALGKSMQMTVIAEGVENQHQSAFLQRLGCNQAQGFYYSQPISAESFKHEVRLIADL